MEITRIFFLNPYKQSTVLRTYTITCLRLIPSDLHSNSPTYLPMYGTYVGIVSIIKVWYMYLYNTGNIVPELHSTCTGTSTVPYQYSNYSNAHFFRYDLFILFVSWLSSCSIQITVPIVLRTYISVQNIWNFNFSFLKKKFQNIYVVLL